MVSEEKKADRMNEEKEIEETGIPIDEDAQGSENNEKKTGEGNDNTSSTNDDIEGNTEQSKESEDLKTQYLRLAADFQNFKKRSEKEKSDIYAHANKEIALDMLEVIDSFEIALSHKDSVEKNFVSGMEKILKQFQTVLEKNGIEEINAEGEEFDPIFHHAVMTEDTEDFESGHVSAVLKKGYILNGKVIRAAMVKVSK